MDERFSSQRLNRKRILSLLIFLFILTALPLVVFLASQKQLQDTRTRANTEEDVVTLTKELLSDQGDDSRQISVSLARKEKMITLAKTDTETFLLNTITEEIKDTLPPLAQEKIEKKIIVEGMVIENVIEEETTNSKNAPYIIQVLNKDGFIKNAYQLYSREGLSIEPNQNLKIEGYAIDNILIPIKVEPISPAIEHKEEVLGVSTTGNNKKIAVLMINFKQDLSDTKNQFTRSELAEVYFTGTPSVSKYLKQASFNQITFQGSISDVYGWITLTNFTRNNVCDINETGSGRGFISTAIDKAKVKAQERGINFDEYEFIGFIFPYSSADCYWKSAIARGVGNIESTALPYHFLNGDYCAHSTNCSSKDKKFYAGLLSHELSHNLGLSHANGLDCGDKIVDKYANCKSLTYADRFDIIGGSWTYFPFPSSSNRINHLKWIPETSRKNVNINNLRADKTYTIYSSSLQREINQTQLIRIPREVDNGAYYIEYRSKHGLDSDFPSDVFKGIVIRLSEIPNGVLANEDGGLQYRPQQTYLLDLSNRNPNSWADFLNPSLKDGKTFEDARNRIKITQLSHNESQGTATLKIDLSPPACEKSNPSLIITDPSLSGSPGEKVKYELTVKNNNSTSCSAETFNLTAQPQNNWNANISNNQVSLAPGESKVLYAEITSPSSAQTEGNPYIANITAQAASSTSFNTTKQIKYNVIQNSPASKPNLPIGYLDAADCNSFRGWTCDADNYSQPIDVHFYVNGPAGGGGTFISGLTANQSRSDLPPAGVCGGNANHGFSFATPQNLKDGKAHTIYAYSINIGPNSSNPLLSGSPKTITCTASTTSTPTSKPTATSTPKQTNTPTPRPSATPVPPTPTNIPTGTPTLTPQPSDTVLKFNSVKLHGIGKGGDNANPNLNGNLNPTTAVRELNIEIYNTSGNLITNAKGNIVYSSANGDFSGNIIIDPTINPGNYLIKVKTDKYLRRQLNGIITINIKSINQMPAVTLIAGDTNGDGLLSILDYNIILDCYSDLRPAKNCTDTAKKHKADLSDDGKVNQDDYNLLLRELSIQTGE